MVLLCFSFVMHAKQSHQVCVKNVRVDSSVIDGWWETSGSLYRNGFVSLSYVQYVCYCRHFITTKKILISNSLLATCCIGKYVNKKTNIWKYLVNNWQLKSGYLWKSLSNKYISSLLNCWKTLKKDWKLKKKTECICAFLNVTQVSKYISGYNLDASF